MNFDLLLGQTESFDERKEDYVHANTEAPIRVRFSEPVQRLDRNPTVLDLAEPSEAQVPFMFGPAD